MHGMQLSGVDANLFVVLHALLETGHVGRAARRLGLSPSATSHALSRLRGLLGDPLFVRAGRRLVPTPHALALKDELGRAVESLEATLRPRRAIDPATLTRAFRIETTDHVQLVLLRALDAIARKEVPHVDVYLKSLEPETFGRLRDGSIDLAIAVYGETDPDLEKRVLFQDRLVAVVRKGHPACRGTMTAARFAKADHLLVAPNGTPTGLVDRLLAERGLKRRVARTSSSFLDVAFLLSETDYVVSLPESLVRPLTQRLGLVVLPLPLTLPSFEIAMIWHRRHGNDPAHTWLRDAVVRAATPSARPAPRPRRRGHATRAA
jgi:DNA-binding transcriptional LysR family regulator